MNQYSLMAELKPVIVVCHEVHHVDEFEFRLGHLPEVGEIVSIGQSEYEVILWVEGTAVPERIIHVAPL